MSGVHKLVRGSILFVDDDPFFRDLASSTLDEAGHRVQLAENGEQALALLARQPFDLVVLDLALPGKSGFEVLEEIRTTLQKTDVPVIVITGNDDAASVERAFEIGATSFLAKPLNWHLFVHHVNFVLKAARAQSALRDTSRTADLMSKLKSRLVGTLVTEFLAPLRTAHGVATLLKQEADGPLGSPLYTSLVGDLHRAIEQLNGTHLKMLNFGRNLAEGVALDETVLDPIELVVTAVESAGERARRRMIEIRFTNGVPAGTQLRGDRVLLGQVVGAVLSNAVQFSRRGSNIEVRIDVTVQGLLTISVLDTSIGFTQANINEIMGVGSSAAAGTAEVVDHSTGLKLARVLIEAHQGAMTATVGERDGLLVEIALPKARLVVAGSLMQATPRSMAAAPLATGAEAAPRRRLA